MATQAENPPPAAAGTESGTKAPDLVRLASELGKKHGAGATKPAAGPSPGTGGLPNKGGRRTVAEEAREWMAKQGLVAVPSAQSAGPVPVDTLPAYVVDPAFVEGCTKTLLEGVQAYHARQVALKVLAIGGDKDLAREFAGEAEAPPGAIEVMAKCAAEMSVQYAWLSQATPVTLFVVAAGVWVSKDVMLWRKLNALEALKGKEARAKQPPSVPVPAPG